MNDDVIAPLALELLIASKISDLGQYFLQLFASPWIISRYYSSKDVFAMVFLFLFLSLLVSMMLSLQVAGEFGVDAIKYFQGEIKLVLLTIGSSELSYSWSDTNFFTLTIEVSVLVLW